MSEAFEEAARVAESEPEVPGPMPAKLRWRCRMDPEGWTRATVAITKRNIARRIRELVGEAAKERQSGAPRVVFESGSRVAHPAPDELDDQFGLTEDEVAELRGLVERCEAAVTSFSNDEMSLALVLVDRLRSRWRLLRRALEDA
jgi:hypothetical protein